MNLFNLIIKQTHNYKYFTHFLKKLNIVHFLQKIIQNFFISEELNTQICQDDSSINKENQGVLVVNNYSIFRQF